MKPSKISVPASFFTFMYIRPKNFVLSIFTPRPCRYFQQRIILIFICLKLMRLFTGKRVGEERGGQDTLFQSSREDLGPACSEIDKKS